MLSTQLFNIVWQSGKPCCWSSSSLSPVLTAEVGFLSVVADIVLNAERAKARQHRRVDTLKPREDNGSIGKYIRVHLGVILQSYLVSQFRVSRSHK